MSSNTWGRLLHRLVEDGSLDGDAALAGRITVEPRNRSHDVAVIRQDTRAVYVAKHHRDSPDPGDPAGTEVAIYRWLAAQQATGAALAPAPPGATLAPAPADGALAPGLLGVVDDTLLLEARDQDVPLHLALRVGACPPEALLSALGRLLGRLHAAAPPPCRLGTADAGPPWVLAVADGALPPSFYGDDRIADLADEVADDLDLAGCLTALAERWPDAGDMAGPHDAVLVHGDVKFDNVLVETRPGVGPRLRLLDWELAGPGLAAWDLAGIVDGLLVPALQVLPTGRALEEREHADAALESHRRVPGAPEVSREELTLATVARLVQSAVQLLAMRHQEPGCAESVAPVLAGARALAQHASAGAR